MTRRTLRATGLGLVAALALLVSGCSEDETPPTAEESPTGASAAPAVELTSAADALAGTSFKFEMELGDELSGVGAADPAAGVGTVTLTVAEPTTGQVMEMEVIFTETDLWMNFGEMSAVLGASAPWMHLDLSRLGDGGVMGWQPGQADPANAAGMLAGIDNVERVDARTFRGEVDLSQVDGSAFADAVEDPAAAEAMPVTVTLDASGRLDTITMELPASDDLPAQTIRIRYFDYGTDVSVAPPPEDQVAPAPDLIYGMMTA